MCIRDRSTSASRAAASIRLAPSATSSSSVVDSSASADVSTCTLSIGVPSSPAFHRQRLLVLFKEEGTSRPRSGGASTSSGYISTPDKYRTNDPAAWSDWERWVQETLAGTPLPEVSAPHG